jgi:succinoglycan biosynthesis transport protein ExoP
MLFGLLGGLFLGVGLAFILEFMDNRIKSPNEIKVHLGLPVLGFLPLVAKQAEKGFPLLGKGVPDVFTESFRAIRTNVVFSSAEQGAKSIVITSTGPGEGKTVVATNLAVSLAQAGERVVLVDGDMRRPQVHKAFGIGLEPGLSNLMVGNAKATDAVRKSDVPSLWLVTGGRIPPNPAEILGSTRFREFLSSLAEHFDWVVIDSPPVMAVTDAAILAHNASGVLFVVRADATNRHTAQAALNQLDASQAKFFGGVVNGLDLARNGFYYSQFYKPEYGAYYTGAQKVGSSSNAPLKRVAR